MKQWYENIVYLDYWISGASLKSTFHVSASLEKWCCSQTFRNRRHGKGPWGLTRRRGTSKGGERTAQITQATFHLHIEILDGDVRKVRFATGSRYPTVPPGNAAKKLPPRAPVCPPEILHREAGECASRKLLPTWCSLKRIRKAPFPQGSQLYAINRVVNPLTHHSVSKESFIEIQPSAKTDLAQW